MIWTMLFFFFSNFYWPPWLFDMFVVCCWMRGIGLCGRLGVEVFGIYMPYADGRDVGRGEGRGTQGREGKALNVTGRAAEGVRSIGFLVWAIVFVKDDYVSSRGGGKGEGRGGLWEVWREGTIH